MWIPKIKKWLPKYLHNNYDFTSLALEYVRACSSLADMQEYHDIDLSQMSQGIIRNLQSGCIFMSKSNLTSSDMFNIGMEARKLSYFSGALKWFKASIERAKEENKPKNYYRKIRYLTVSMHLGCPKPRLGSTLKKAFGSSLALGSKDAQRFWAQLDAGLIC